MARSGNRYARYWVRGAVFAGGGASKQKLFRPGSDITIGTLMSNDFVVPGWVHGTLTALAGGCRLQLIPGSSVHMAGREGLLVVSYEPGMDTVDVCRERVKFVLPDVHLFLSFHGTRRTAEAMRKATESSGHSVPALE